MSYKLIAELFGTDRRTKPYKALRRLVPEEPILHDGGLFIAYQFYQHGFTVAFNKSKRHFAIADFIGTPYEQFSDYKGDMPNGVLVSDKKIDVCRKLGDPFESGRSRRSLSVPDDPTDEEWKEFLARQSAEPLTHEWCVFRVEDLEFRFWFDDDLEGRMQSVCMGRHTLNQTKLWEETRRLVKELKEIENKEERRSRKQERRHAK